MPLTIGTRIGQYEIVAPLGQGGMGEVYRARDTRLKRDVAIKVLPDLWARDAERLARFRREAELLATLNHPRVAAIYGLEETKTTTAIVMELVEGETLAERIARGPMSLDDVVTVARQVADALEAAHERGIVHRDLKPANIKISEADSVKVLDFGLAKLTETAATASSLSMSPTLSVPGTYAGTILGTAAYMSPEQARGKSVDRRADIWAFGCVLFEMLTGRQAFETGETVSDAIAAILLTDPDWNLLPPDTPPQIRTLLKRCLQKDLQKRLPHIGLVRVEFDDPAPPVIAPTVPVPKGSRWRFASFAIAGALLGIAVTTAGVWIAARFATPPPLEQNRFSIVSPAGAPLRPGGGDVNVAISADGRQIVYVTGIAGENGAVGGGGATDGQLWIRSLDQPDPVPLRGITGRYPFFSPDGKWIGFFQAGFELNKVPVTGGPAVHLSHIDGSPRGGTWGPDKSIVFGTAGGALWIVPEGGGDPTRVSTVPDGTLRRVNPLFLPNGRTILFMLTPGTGLNSQIVALDLATHTEKTLIPTGGNAAYVNGGFLVYSLQGTLRAVRFDPDTLKLSGDPVPVLEGVMAAGGGGAEFALSPNGTLVYVPGGEGAGELQSLVWVDRGGMETPTGAPPRQYAVARLSPDGANAALDVREQGSGDIYTFNFERKNLHRLTTDPAYDMAPVYTPDGRLIVYASTRGTGRPSIFRRPADGTGTDERLTTSANFQQPSGFAPNGSLLIREDEPSSGREIRVLSMDPSTLKDGKALSQPLIHTSFNNEAPDISRDGHFIAYATNESSIPQVIVRPFPNVNDGLWQITTDGGVKPAWAHKSNELFYLDMNNFMWVVPFETTPVFKPGIAKMLFQGPWYVRQSVRTYDVSPDDQRFLMIKDAPGDGRSAAASASLDVWVNWVEELKRRVGG